MRACSCNDASPRGQVAGKQQLPTPCTLLDRGRRHGHSAPPLLTLVHVCCPAVHQVVQNLWLQGRPGRLPQSVHGGAQHGSRTHAVAYVAVHPLCSAEHEMCGSLAGPASSSTTPRRPHAARCNVSLPNTRASRQPAAFRCHGKHPLTSGWSKRSSRPVLRIMPRNQALDLVPAAHRAGQGTAGGRRAAEEQTWGGVGWVGGTRHGSFYLGVLVPAPHCLPPKQKNATSVRRQSPHGANAGPQKWGTNGGRQQAGAHSILPPLPPLPACCLLGPLRRPPTCDGRQQALGNGDGREDEWAATHDDDVLRPAGHRHHGLLQQLVGRLQHGGLQNSKLLWGVSNQMNLSPT